MNDLQVLLAEEHRRDLLRQACRQRLAVLATCCRPSVLRRTARAVLAWARDGQLGPGYVDPRKATAPGVDRNYCSPCCP